ncbi:unnamed protein product [Arctia plantaginis]|uniref:Uncharacterized protein n=1 Tax=Arctia plantaginis TaxID=874455 RepID=A0A8S0ZZ70_ARCPL|nr:unnamed protein product [Arctia plantaginis]
MWTAFPLTDGNFNSDRHLGKTAVIDAELVQLRIAIAALQETQIADEGYLRKSNYTFSWKGRDSSEARQHGVGFAMRNDFLNSVEGFRGVSIRIMVCRFNTDSGFITLMSAYARTLSSSAELKDIFYYRLSRTVREVRSGDRLIILEYFNAQVGQSQTSWPECVGSHVVGKINENGQRLLEFCSQNLLCVTNTYFKGIFTRKVSWKHPRSGHWHQFDVTFTRKKDLRDILYSRTFYSANCDTDHSLVVTTASF